MTDDEFRDNDEQDIDLTAPVEDEEEVEDLDTSIKDPLLEEDTESLDLLAEEEEDEVDLEDDEM